MKVVDQGVPITDPEVLQLLKERGADAPPETSKAYPVERRAYEALLRKGEDGEARESEMMRKSLFRT